MKKYFGWLFNYHNRTPPWIAWSGYIACVAFFLNAIAVVPTQRNEQPKSSEQVSHGSTGSKYSSSVSQPAVSPDVPPEQTGMPKIPASTPAKTLVTTPVNPQPVTPPEAQKPAPSPPPMIPDLSNDDDGATINFTKPNKQKFDFQN